MVYFTPANSLGLSISIVSPCDYYFYQLFDKQNLMCVKNNSLRMKCNNFDQVIVGL